MGFDWGRMRRAVDEVIRNRHRLKKKLMTKFVDAPITSEIRSVLVLERSECEREIRLARGGAWCS